MQRREFVLSAAGLSLLPSVAAGSRLQAQSQADIRQAYIQVEDTQIYFWTAGRGQPLVLIHQSGNSSEEYAALVSHLKADFFLVAVDLPGHGRSDDPIQPPTVDDYTKAVEGVMDHLELSKVAVLGHHGGALVAMNLVARNPARFSHALLSGTSGLRSPEESEAFLAELAKSPAEIESDPQWVAEAWARYQKMKSPGAKLGDIFKAYVAFLEARLRPYRAIFVYLKWDRRPALRSLKLPVLLMQGLEDPYVSQQETLLDLIPNAKRVVLPHCGTFMFYDKPAVCAQTIHEYLEG